MYEWPGYGLASFATSADIYERYDGSKDKVIWQAETYDPSVSIDLSGKPLALSSPITYDDKFSGNIYPRGKTDSPYWHKDKGLIVDETHLAISKAKSIFTDANNNLPKARQVEFYGDGPGTSNKRWINYFGLDKITRGDRIFNNTGVSTNHFLGDIYVNQNLPRQQKKVLMGKL